MKKLLALLIVLLALTGCSKPKNTVVTCSYSGISNNVDYSVETKLQFEDDRVDVKTNTEVFKFEDEESLTKYRDMMDLMKSMYAHINAEYNYVVDGLTITVTSVINYGTVDIVGLVQMDQNETITMNDEKTHMSLTKMLEFYRDSGRECTE